MNQQEIPRMKLEEIGGDDYIDLFKIEPGHVITISDRWNDAWYLSRIFFDRTSRLWLKGVMIYGASMGPVKLVDPTDMYVDRYIKLNQPFYYGKFQSRNQTSTAPIQKIYVDGHLMLEA